MRKFVLLILSVLFAHNSYASLPYFPIEFPRDEGAHFQNTPYKINRLIEWWYFNGALTTDDGKHLSYDVAFFNAAANMSGIVTKPMLHIQVADLDHNKAYGVAKNYLYNTGKISTNDLDFTINKDYRLTKSIINGKAIYILQTDATSDGNHIKINLMLTPKSEPFLINDNGLMPMPENTNSYYYSIPEFSTTGTIELNKQVYSINKSSGSSWMDHQWGDFDVSKNGWEWFSVRLSNGLIANIFLNVEYKSNRVISGLANIILPDGTKRFIPYQEMIVTRDNYWFDQKQSINYPMTFRINIPAIGLSLENSTTFPEQEIYGYWEGLCKVKAVYNKVDLQGYSYMELVYRSPA